MWRLNTWLSAVDQHCGAITTWGLAFTLCVGVWVHVRNTVPVWRQHRRPSGLASAPFPTLCPPFYPTADIQSHTCLIPSLCKRQRREALVTLPVSRLRISFQTLQRPVGKSLRFRPQLCSKVTNVHLSLVDSTRDNSLKHAPLKATDMCHICLYNMSYIMGAIKTSSQSRQAKMSSRARERETISSHSVCNELKYESGKSIWIQ